MSRILFAINDLTEEIGRLHPGAPKVVLSMAPATYRAVAGEVANQMGGLNGAITEQHLIHGEPQVDLGKIVLRAVHG